ncbi:hypothetical protein, partial [Streptomyces sp. NPDC006459]|uniref:hypothetical protein n=1 Tax=Streptomyces sp. NPDC006459 TaxID=3154303 RepID=UPI0033A77E4A
TSSTEVDGVSTSGVDFWHAVEFSRNGRFLCTPPRDIRWGFPPGFRSILAFPTLSDAFVSDFLGAFQVFAFAFPFPAVPTLPDHFRADSGSDLNWWPLERPFPFGRIRLYQVSLGRDSRPPA